MAPAEVEGASYGREAVDALKQSRSKAKLPRLSNSELLSRYRGRIERSRSWRETEGYDATWVRLREMYRGKQFEGLSREDRIAVNLLWATINVIHPSVSVNHPKITVNARKEDGGDQARITEAVINYWWNHFDFRDPFQRAVLDFLIVGHGWLKVGYAYDEREEDLPDDKVADSFSEAVAEADDYATDLPELANELPSDSDIYDSLPKTEQIVVQDQVTLERVSPLDMFVDPEADHLADAAWVAQRVTRDVEEAKRDENYDAAARKKLEPDSDARTPSEEHKKRYSSDVERVTIWEFYDIKRETVCVFAKGGENFLVKPKAFPYACGLPFEMLRNHDVPDCFYPVGDIETIEPLQNELNKTRSAMMNHRKKLAQKFIFDPTAFGPEGIDALRSDEHGTMVPIGETTKTLAEVVRPIDSGTIDSQMYAYSDTIIGDIDRVTGINEYQRGALPEISRTATEASIIQDAANARSSHKLSRVENSIRAIARKLVALAQQYMTQEQYAYLVGMNETVWFEYTREDISAEVDFSVETGSTQPKNETFKAQQALDLMQVLTPFMGSGLINDQMLITHVLREGFGIQNPERFMGPGPMPMLPEAEEVPPGEAPPEGEGGPVAGEEGFVPQGGMPGLQQQLEGQVGLTLENLLAGMPPGA